MNGGVYVVALLTVAAVVVFACYTWASRRPSALRSAYEDAKAERDRLLTLVERYAEREYRLARREAGLPEREPEQREVLATWTPELEAAVQRWGPSMALQRSLAERRLRGGWTVQAVLASLQPSEDEDDR